MNEVSSSGCLRFKLIMHTHTHRMTKFKIGGKSNQIDWKLPTCEILIK